METALKALQRHLDRMPLGKVVLRPATSGAQMSDAEVWFYDKFVGVVKVYQTELYLQDLRTAGWELPITELTAIRQNFYTARRWTKRVALLLVTADEHVLLMDMSTIARDFRQFADRDPSGEKVRIALDETVRL